MQAVEGRQQWTLTFGSSEIRSHVAGSTNKRAIHSATPTGLDSIVVQYHTMTQADVKLTCIYHFIKISNLPLPLTEPMALQETLISWATKEIRAVTEGNNNAYCLSAAETFL